MIAISKLTKSGRDATIKSNSKIQDSYDFVGGVEAGDCNRDWLGKMIYKNKAYNTDGSDFDNNGFFTGGIFEDKHVYCEKTDSGQYKWIAYN